MRHPGYFGTELFKLSVHLIELSPILLRVIALLCWRRPGLLVSILSSSPDIFLLISSILITKLVVQSPKLILNLLDMGLKRLLLISLQLKLS